MPLAMATKYVLREARDLCRPLCGRPEELLLSRMTAKSCGTQNWYACPDFVTATLIARFYFAIGPYFAHNGKTSKHMAANGLPSP